MPSKEGRHDHLPIGQFDGLGNRGSISAPVSEFDWQHRVQHSQFNKKVANGDKRRNRPLNGKKKIKMWCEVIQQERM